MACLIIESNRFREPMSTPLALLQVLAPPQMRARLMSLFFTLTFGMQPVASLLAGYSADTLTTPMAIRVNGLLLLVGAILIMAARPALRRWEANASQHTTVIADAV
jgi:hypothetical protein